MAESRRELRQKKRLTVRFGDSAPQHIGYTSDVSSQGLFLEARIVYRPGVILNLEIETRDGSLVQMVGEVRWAKKAPVRASHFMKSGMGIKIRRIVTGADLFASFIAPT